MSKEAELVEVNKPKGDWSFDAAVAPVFDEHVRKSVPMYDIFHRQVQEFSNWFVQDGTNVYDIGTSTGQVILNLLNYHSKKHVNIIGVDTSQQMIEQAYMRLQNWKEAHGGDSFQFNSNINLKCGDVLSEDFPIENASLITSVLTAQFIPLNKRMDLFEKVYEGLNDGGAFILIEKIVSGNTYINDMFIQMYHDLKLENGFTPDHVLQKQASLRGVMKPVTKEDNIAMLMEAAGFKYVNIDTFFQWNNFVGIIAIKD